MLFVDAVTLVLTLWISFSIRLGLWYVPVNDFIFWLFFAAPVIGGIIFLRFGLYRTVTRYTSFNALWTIAQAVSLYALVWATIFLAGHNIPRSVVLINWLLSVLGIMCLRMSARWLLSLKRSDIKRKRTLIYGVGDAGMQLAGALGHSSDYRLVGFVDEEKGFLHTQILGLDVYPANSISAVINKLNIEEVLLAIPSASRAKRFDIVSALETQSVKVRMLPRVADLAGGKVTSDDLQEVNIEDLLGRDAVPCLIVCVAVYASSHGPVIYWSQRIGRHNNVFTMPKFRTMHPHTPEIATHLLVDPDKYLTSVGRFLRKTSLDELPQFWSVLQGHMSIVGPRPALVSQNDLIDLRTLAGVHTLTPGITGWAQIQGRDNLSVPQKVALDIDYMNKVGFFMDIKIIGLTILSIVKHNDVAH